MMKDSERHLGRPNFPIYSNRLPQFFLRPRHPSFLAISAPISKTWREASPTLLGPCGTTDLPRFHLALGPFLIELAPRPLLVAFYTFLTAQCRCSDLFFLITLCAAFSKFSPIPLTSVCFSGSFRIDHHTALLPQCQPFFRFRFISFSYLL